MYAHRFSPHTFTQPQLFACLVLKSFFRTDYRGIVAMLRDMPHLCRTLGLRRLPHYTTLQQANHRLLRFAQVCLLLNASFQLLMGRRTRVPWAAADSTGFESSRISPYFVKRRRRGQNSLQSPLYETTTYTRYPKLAVLSDCGTHMILAVRPTRGPTPDVAELLGLLRQLIPRASIQRLLADAGYDSELNHCLLREGSDIRSYIPPKRGRPTEKPATGRYRRLMQRLFQDPEEIGYGQRWQVETVMSMLKRNLGCAVAGRSYWSQCRDLLLKAVTHNVMIVRSRRASLQSRTAPIFQE